MIKIFSMTQFIFSSDILLTLAYCYALPIVGIPSSKTRSKRSEWLSEAEYLAVPKSFLSFLVGFIDADGCIYIKQGKNVTLKLVISLHLNDIVTLQYIHSVLKIGKIQTYPLSKSPTVRLIFNRTELQEVLFPLFLHHGIFFLTKNRNAQYDLAMHILKNNIKTSSEPIKSVTVVNKQPETAEEYLNLSFFKNWIVGFTCGEGSFFIKANNDGCFQLKQKFHFLLFYALKLVFNTNRKITIDKGLYTQFGVSSKSDIQEVINFFSFSGHHPLVGLKNIQYSVWIENLKYSSRYSKLNFPSS
uniref:Homing endonuclease LAGLIDADG domain-containing protein n=1 Tax=Dactylella sp. TaxID=1814903 RepID=A0A482DT52_9PEZI|nr:hypothetical protein [Dactylella sp.]